MKVCNNGAIVGRIVRAENNTYVSQLFISVSTITVGTNISCLHETGSSMKLIGTSLLTLTTGNTSQKTENLLNHSVLYFADPYPPPDTIYLMEANSSQLNFQWSSVAPLCEAIHYHINASNCGHCPSVTDDTTVTCSGFSLDNQVCLLAVRTVVCDNITGDESSRVQVILRGIFQITLAYHWSIYLY